MEVVQLGALPVATVRWMPQEGRFSQLVVCKATFDLGPGTLRLAATQEPVHLHDRHYNGNRAASLYAPADRVPQKARAEVMVVGQAYAPRGQPVRSLKVGIALKEMDKRIEVSCDRWFDAGGALQEGAPFTTMPLSWEQAAGGPDSINPVGIDMRDGAPDRFGRRRVPNLQTIGAQVTEIGDVLEPVGLGPQGPNWQLRVAKLGHQPVDGWPAEWHRKPLPKHFNFGYFNAAPGDQQLTELSADDQLELEHLHPDEPLLKCTLPGLVPKAYLVTATAVREVSLLADSLWIDTGKRICTVTWRGSAELESPAETGRILVAEQESGQPLGWPQVMALARQKKIGFQLPLAATGPLPQARAKEPSAPPDSDSFEPTVTQRIRPALFEEATELAMQLPGGRPAALPFLPSDRPQTPPRPEDRPAVPGMPAAWQSRRPLPSVPEPANQGVAARPPLPSTAASPPPAEIRPAGGPPAPPIRPPSMIWEAGGDLPRSGPNGPMAILPAVAQPLPATLRAGSSAVPPPPPQRVPLGSRPERSELPPPRLSPGLPSLSAPAPAGPLISSEQVARSEEPGPGAVEGPAKELAPPGRPSEAPAPAARQDRRRTLEIIWYDEEKLPSWQAHEPFAELLAEPEPSAPTGKDDADGKANGGEDEEDSIDAERSPPGFVPEPDEDEKEPAPPSPEELRRMVSRVLNEALPTKLSSLEWLLFDQTDDHGSVKPPLALVAGELRLSFDAMEELRLSADGARPFTQSDKKLEELLGVIDKVLSNKMAEARPFTEELNKRWRQSDRLLSADYLQRLASRGLLEGRKYQIRELWDKKWVRATLHGSGQEAVIYLPEAAGKQLPLFTSFPARLVVEVLPCQDATEKCPIALRIQALARVILRSSRGASR